MNIKQPTVNVPETLQRYNTRPLHLSIRTFLTLFTLIFLCNTFSVGNEIPSYAGCPDLVHTCMVEPDIAELYINLREKFEYEPEFASGMIIPDSVKTGVEDDFTPGVMGGSNTTNNCFSYDPYVIGLNPPPFVPSTSLPGSHLEPPDCTTFPGVCVNAILFMGRNVVNLEGVVVDYEFIEVDCSTGADVGIALYSNTIVVVEDPFVTGIMLITCVEQGGNCYRLDLTYDDGCDENPVTDSYFFKHGDCAEDTTTYVNDLIEDPNNRGLSIKVSVNPIRDATLKLDLTGELSGAAAAEAFISIFDAAGRVLTSQPLSFDGRQAMVPFDAVPGIYFYSARIGGQTFTGKFVKL